MQSRKFIKNTTEGLPLIYLTPNVLASCVENEAPIIPNRKKVMMFGAVISGPKKTSKQA